MLMKFRIMSKRSYGESERGVISGGMLGNDREVKKGGREWLGRGEVGLVST